MMTQAITQQEIDRLRAPFPLAAHSIREGNKVRGGKGIQWFVYVEKTEVESRLNEVFPGEWGSSQPVLYPMGNAMAATISITIRGITRGNTGEDSNGTEKAKGATTDAFRRAAADWGVAKYLWEMEFSIYTDAYPDKDWNARDAKEKEALEKFAAWYKKKFNISPMPPENPQRSPQKALQGNGPTDRTIAPQTAQKPQNGSNSPVAVNDSADVPQIAPSGTVVSNSGNSWAYDLPALMAHADLVRTYPNYNHRANAIKLLHEGGHFENVANISEAVKIVINRPDKQEAVS